MASAGACLSFLQTMKRFPRTKAVAQRLRALRESRGLTQVVVAREARIAQPSLSNYETGKREVTLATAMSLAAALDVTFCQLIGLETDHLIIPAGSRLARATRALEDSPELLDWVLDSRARRVMAWAGGIADAADSSR